MLRPGVTQEWVDEGELPRERTKNRRWRRPYDVLAEAMHGEVENKIDASPATRCRRPCIRVAVCLSIDQGELLGGHSGVKASGRKGRGSDDESGGVQQHKSNTESARALNRIAKAMYGSYSLSFHRPRRTAPENIEVLKQVVERGKEERQVQRGSAT
ncbi:hypothetical protein BHM03_00026617 [Ensete ventricosum]|nr:hypothetical protein BHM03_00026617 [Ensete ventricosum]